MTFAAQEKTTPGAWFPPVGGLVITAWLAWEICPISSPTSAAMAVAEAIVYVSAVLFSGGMVTWFLHRKIVSGKALDTLRVTLHTAAIAVLFAPLVLLSFQRSAWFLLVTALIVAGIAGLARSEQSPGGQAPPSEISPAQLFSMPEARSPILQFGPSSTGALCLHLAVLAYVINERFLTAAFLGVAALLLSRFRAEPTQKKVNDYSSSVWKIAFSTSLAMALTLAGLWRWFVLRHPQPADSPLSLLVQLIFQDTPKSAGVRREKAQAPPNEQSYGSGGLYSGVILWDEEPRAAILAPPLPTLYPQAFQDKPIGIPFSGYYSFFKPPLHHAPRNSTRMRGTPANIGLRSSDEYAILMEAHQDFANLVDLDCCKKIQIVIRNRESHSEAVRCEMVFNDTSVPPRSELSLGSEQLPEGEKVASNSVQGNSQQVLTFVVPRARTHFRFNEITVRYHLSGMHSGTSARVAIEKFVFVPQ